MTQDNNIRFIIIGLLNHEPMSGYDLKKRIDQAFSHIWPASYGQIYPTLQKMTEEGFITLVSKTQSKGPQKSVYKVAPKGEQVLQDWLTEPETKEYTRFEILLKLFFSSSVSTDITVERINAFKARHQENLAKMGLFKQSLEPHLNSDPDHLYFYLTILFGERVYRAYLDWASEATQLLKDKGKTQ